MSKSTIKKLIAREFLFLLGLLAITALAWLGIILYNYSLESKIEHTVSDLLVAEKKLDSLISNQKVYVELPNIQRLYSTLAKDNYELPDFTTFQNALKEEKNLTKLYNQIKDSYDLPNYAAFKKDMTQRQNVRVYPEASEQVLKELAATILEKPYLTELELFHKFPEIENDTVAIRLAKEYVDVLRRNPDIPTEEISIIFPQFSYYLSELPRLNDDGEVIILPNLKRAKTNKSIVSAQEKRVSELKAKKDNLKSPLTNDDIKDLLISIFLYGLIIAFGGRYLYMATKWAIKTVKE